MSWDVLGRYGDSEDEIRQASEEAGAAALHDLRMRLRADGYPLGLIERAVALADALQREALDRDLPLVIRDLAVSAGATSMQ